MRIRMRMRMWMWMWMWMMAAPQHPGRTKKTYLTLYNQFVSMRRPTTSVRKTFANMHEPMHAKQRGVRFSLHTIAGHGRRNDDRREPEEKAYTKTPSFRFVRYPSDHPTCPGERCEAPTIGRCVPVMLRCRLPFCVFQHMPTFSFHGLYLLFQLQGARSRGECFSW